MVKTTLDVLQKISSDYQRSPNFSSGVRYTNPATMMEYAHSPFIFFTCFDFSIFSIIWMLFDNDIYPDARFIPIWGLAPSDNVQADQ